MLAVCDESEHYLVALLSTCEYSFYGNGENKGGKKFLVSGVNKSNLFALPLANS